MPIFIIILFFVFVFPVKASLYINEVYPYPPSTSDGQEYIEIYNDGEALNLQDYVLEDEAGNKIIFLDATVATSSYTLAQSKNVLNNSGDSVKLKFKNGTLLQSLTYPSIAENNSYSKCYSSDSWIQTNPTKMGQNEVCSSPTLPVQPSDSPSPSPINEDDITISEVVAYPDKDVKEWVEIYNSSDKPYYLRNWYIDDAENGGGSPYTFSLELPPKGYNVVELNRDMFNNDKDEVRLLNNNKKVVDKTSYNEMKMQHSWARNGETFCLQIPTRTKPNTQCIVTPTSVIATETPADSPTESPVDPTEADPPDQLTEYTPAISPSVTPQVLGSTTTKKESEDNAKDKTYFIMFLSGIIVITMIILVVRVRKDLANKYS
jgi:hypothetical protein